MCNYKIKNLDWDLVKIKDIGQVTINALPVAVNAVSYGFLLRAYMKHVHNRPYPHFLSDIDKKIELKTRNRHLFTFLMIGAPLTYFAIKEATPILNKFVSFTVTSNTDIQINNNNNSTLLKKQYNLRSR